MVRTKDSWFWMIPLKGNTTSIGVVMDTEKFRSMKMSPEEALTHCIAEQPVVNEWMEKARRVTNVYATGDFSYRNRHFSVIVGYWRATRRDSLIRYSAAAFISLCFRARKRRMLSIWFWIGRRIAPRPFAPTNSGLAACWIFIYDGPPPGTPRSLSKCSSFQRKFLNSFRRSAQSFLEMRFVISACAGDFVFFRRWSRSRNEHQKSLQS